MARHTTFAIDLALIGGQDEATTRALPWKAFVAHWKEHLPAADARAWWDDRRHRLTWKAAVEAPKEWSTTTWPDFAHKSKDKQNKLVDPTQTPVTLLHMALLDSADEVDGALDAFEFLLLAGVSPNVWVGHGSTVLSRACLMAHLPAMGALFDAGCDFQNTLPPGANVRPDFAESSLFHRVGPSLAVRVNRSVTFAAGRHGAARKQAKDYTERALSALKFLATHVPDPDALDARGRTPLDLIRRACPEAASALEPLIADRRAQRLAAQWGADPDHPEHARWTKSVRAWAGKGGATAQGEPLVFTPETADPFDPAWPRPFRPVIPPAPHGAVVARVHAVHRVTELPSEVSSEGIAAIARQNDADAVVVGRGSQAQWWFFSPHQIKPALGFLESPQQVSASPRPRL